MVHYFIYADRHSEAKKPEFSINVQLPSRKYYQAWAYFAGWTLIDLVRGKSSTFSHLQGKTLWPISSSSSFCCGIGLSESMLLCSFLSNFHLVAKAVFFNFVAFFFLVFPLASYPSNNTQMSWAHLHLPHPNDSWPPAWHAHSMNADDALYVRQFLRRTVTVLYKAVPTDILHCVGAFLGVSNSFWWHTDDNPSEGNNASCLATIWPRSPLR